MKTLTGGLFILVAILQGHIFGASPTARMKLVVDSRSSDDTWSVTVYELRNEGRFEHTYIVPGADVQALQNDEIVESGRTGDDGTITFHQLFPENGNVSVQAKRSYANSWEETQHLEWRVPDARIPLAAEIDRTNMEWGPCSAYTTTVNKIVVAGDCRTRDVYTSGYAPACRTECCLSSCTMCSHYCYPTWTPVVSCANASVTYFYLPTYGW